MSFTCTHVEFTNAIGQLETLVGKEFAAGTNQSLAGNGVSTAGHDAVNSLINLNSGGRGLNA